MLGEVRADNRIIIKGKNGKIIVDTDIETAGNAYRETLKNY